MQGALDDNVLPALQEKFAATYRAAGGVCELTVFDGCEHEWVAKPGPQTGRAREMVKAFIARQLHQFDWARGSSDGLAAVWVAGKVGSVASG